MTDQEILSVAARIRAARRRRATKICEVCGAVFEGIARRRYRSIRCRMAASRRRHSTVAANQQPSPRAGAGSGGIDQVLATPAVGAGNVRGRSANDAAVRDERLSSGQTIPRNVAPPAAADEVDNVAPSRSDESPLCEAPKQLPGESTAEYFTRLRAMIFRGRAVDEDSTEIIRRAREERSAQLARLSEK